MSTKTYSDKIHSTDQMLYITKPNRRHKNGDWNDKVAPGDCSQSCALTVQDLVNKFGYERYSIMWVIANNEDIDFGQDPEGELSKKSKDFGNISFFPKIRKNQVASAIEYFDVCFVGRNNTPLFKHGVSANKYFDYMLAGKPVLDSNNKIKDPVELSKCGIIVKPDSAIAIADGIQQLFDLSDKERKIMGDKGRKHVDEHHNILYLSNLYIKLFEQY